MSFNEDKPLVFQVRNIQDTSNNNAMVGRGSQKVTGAVIQGTIKSGMLVAVHKPRDAAANIIQVTAAEVKQVHKSNESEYLISASCVDGALDVTIQYQKTIEPDCVWECGEYNLLYDANNNDYDGRCELLSPPFYLKVKNINGNLVSGRTLGQGLLMRLELGVRFKDNLRYTIKDILYDESYSEDDPNPILTLELHAVFVGGVGDLLFNPKNLGSKEMTKKATKLPII